MSDAFYAPVSANPALPYAFVPCSHPMIIISLLSYYHASDRIRERKRSEKKLILERKNDL